MHDLFVALAFVAMVACPAVVAAMPQREAEKKPKALPQRSRSESSLFTCWWM